jgi:hypothetical protein
MDRLGRQIRQSEGKVDGKMLTGSDRLRGKRWAYRVFYGLKVGQPATAAVWQPPL